MPDRCDLTELLVDECACRNHRGGRTPEEEAADSRARTGSGIPGPWFVGSYDGKCSRCGDRFAYGGLIRADGAGGWECCDA